MNNKKPKIQIIGGPCSAETEDQVLRLAIWAKKLGWIRFRAGLWKPRTRPGFFEGVGDKGLSWLKAAQDASGVPTMTEVATPRQAEKVLETGLNGFWIGARTTVNPFYVQEIVEVIKGTDTEVWIKNPIHPDLNSWIGAIERFSSAGLKNIGAIHRGFFVFRTSDLRNSPVWSIPLGLKKHFPELPVFCDISHIAGKSERLPMVLRHALHLNFSGIMAEIHEDPVCALTDSEQQIKPDFFSEMIDEIQNNDFKGKESMSNRMMKSEKGQWFEAIDLEIQRLQKIQDDIPNQMDELISHLRIDKK